MTNVRTMTLFAAIAALCTVGIGLAGVELRLDDRRGTPAPATRLPNPAKKAGAPEGKEIKLREKAEQGDAEAQFYLGQAYQDGIGVRQDSEQAVQWWRRAAEQGNPTAQNSLGRAYHTGEGVALDYAQSAHWYRKAAEQGDPQAQSNLGFMYQNGEGVAKNPKEAVQWWLKAAEQGNVSSQYNLAVAYHNGEGVAEDFVEGYKWVDIAGTHSSGESQKKYGVLRDALVKKMTPAQFAEAQKRVREWTNAFELRKRGGEPSRK